MKNEILVELGAWAAMVLMGGGICYLLYAGLKALDLVKPLGAGILVIFIIVGPVGAFVLSECVVKYYGPKPDTDQA